MPDSEDTHGVVFEVKEYAILADPQPKGTGHVPVKRVHFACPRASKSQHALENLHRRGTVQRTHISLGVIQPFDPVWRHLRQVFRWDTKLREDILDRNTLAVALSEPGLALVKTTPILFSHRFIVRRSHGHSARHRIQ